MDRVISKWLVLAVAIPMPVAHVILGLANLHKVTSLWQPLAAMVLTLALVVAICWRTRGHTLPLGSALAVVAGVVIVDVLVTSVLPVGVHPGYAAWHNGAIQMLLVAMAFRNRVLLAWLGMVAFAVLDFSASMAHGLSLVDALALVLTPVMWMVIATAVHIMLGREHAHRLYRDKWMLELEQSARPALEAIAAGALSAGQRQELALLEAELRDQIRGRLLATPEVVQAARAARARGVKVDLLDDRKAPLDSAVLEDAVAQLLGVLRRVESGRVRARALPAGGELAVTILAFDELVPDNEVYAEINEAELAR